MVAHERTIVETVEIARNVARKLLEAQEYVQLPQVHAPYAERSTSRYQFDLR